MKRHPEFVVCPNKKCNRHIHLSGDERLTPLWKLACASCFTCLFEIKGDSQVSELLPAVIVRRVLEKVCAAICPMCAQEDCSYRFWHHRNDPDLKPWKPPYKLEEGRYHTANGESSVWRNARCAAESIREAFKKTFPNL